MGLFHAGLVIDERQVLVNGFREYRDFSKGDVEFIEPFLHIRPNHIARSLRRPLRSSVVQNNLTWHPATAGT